MRLPFRSTRAAEDADTARVRVDASTKALVRRLKPGEIAIIDHLDLDRVSAEALVATQPSAVLNAARSTSGRYPNLGPGIVVAAGIPLIDDLGSQIMTIPEGSRIRIDGATLYDTKGSAIAEGIAQTPETVDAAITEAREGLSVQMEAFAANTMDYLRQERDLILDGLGVPEITTKIDGRHVLVVVRGYHYREDLAMLRSYIREYRPVLIGVDGGADAILEAGLKVDIIVGDMDSVSDRALTSGAEIVVHAYQDGHAPGQERVERLGLRHCVFPATGTSEDIALLLADDKGAELIVAVGTHESLIEFLDKGREGMASTFLTRLRIGGKLIDAKGVSRLYRHRISNWTLALFVFSGISALVAAMLATPAGQAFFGITGAKVDNFFAWFSNYFSSLFQ